MAPDHMPESVRRMLGDNNNPTAPLDEFLVVYNKDNNIWWQISGGHHQNLFEAAVDRIEELGGERDGA